VGTGLSVTGLLGSVPAAFFAGAGLTGAGFGLTFVGSTARVTAASRGSGDVVSLFFALAYVAVSVPIVAVGAVESWLGLRGAFTAFGVFVALTAVVPVTVTARDSRRRA
jgi:hypothetical protein